MFDIDIENGIYTLKRIYFLQCANIQGYTENALIDYISKMCNISKIQAKHRIYSAAVQYTGKADCLEYLKSCIS